MPSSLRKSSEKAEAAKSAGNKSYVERNFFIALEKYNESLCNAVVGSEAVGLAYANRSAVYFEMKLFEKCLKNIELAKDNGYPEKSFLILDKRTEKCAEQIKVGNEAKQDEDPFEFIKLSYQSNPKLPFVADCLELKSSEKLGRYIITKQDLKVGDIVAIETPKFRVIKSDSRYESCQEANKFHRCAFCLKNNLMDLIPCQSCTATMFCSQECLQSAQETFHFYECPIIDSLLKSGIMQMACRTFFQALSMFKGSIEDLQKFLTENKNPKASVYDFDFLNDTSEDKNFLTSLFCLAKSEQVCENDSPKKLLEDHPQLTEIWKDNELFIRKFIQKVLQIGDSNFHGICGWSLKMYQNQFPQMIGIGCYPFISLINHSCAPNVNRIYVDDKMLLLVERPIERGEQLYDCYKSTFYTQPKQDRQMTLLHEYSFRCDCLACSSNFPLFYDLKLFDKKIHKIANKGKQELSKLDANQAKKRFREYCDIIQRHHAKAFPSLEIIILQECLLQCMSLIIKPKLLLA